VKASSGPEGKQENQPQVRAIDHALLVYEPLNKTKPQGSQGRVVFERRDLMNLQGDFTTSMAHVVSAAERPAGKF
jgi:hypothetical protein